jgi:pimeloyl-ACP methyl ester carboxylesterase
LDVAAGGIASCRVARTDGRRETCAGIPQTRYARTADGVHIAYQVHGEGPIDLLMVLGWTTNIEALWEEPSIARSLNRLASSSRLILFDKRGVGLSDRVPESQLPGLETRMDDLRAVMDAASSERGVVCGISEGGPMAMLFAATYPERTRGLLLFGTVADYTTSSDAENEPIELDRIERLWGTEEYARLALHEWAAPSLADDERMVAWLASYTRRSASPGAAIALERMNNGMDASDILHAIHVPTLAIGRSGDLAFPIEEVRRTAERIPGGRFVELPGQDHFFFVGDTERVLVEIEHFLKEIRDDEAELDRVLVTVLYTDIVRIDRTRRGIGRPGVGGAPGLPLREDPVEPREVPRPGGEHGRRQLPRDVRWADRGGALRHERGGVRPRPRHPDPCGPAHGGGRPRRRRCARHRRAHRCEGRLPGRSVGGPRLLDGQGPRRRRRARVRGRGEHQLKGLPGTWRLYRVVTGDRPQRA